MEEPSKTSRPSETGQPQVPKTPDKSDRGSLQGQELDDPEVETLLAVEVAEQAAVEESVAPLEACLLEGQKLPAKLAELLRDYDAVVRTVHSCQRLHAAFAAQFATDFGQLPVVPKMPAHNAVQLSPQGKTTLHRIFCCLAPHLHPDRTAGNPALAADFSLLSTAREQADLLQAITLALKWPKSLNMDWASLDEAAIIQDCQPRIELLQQHSSLLKQSMAWEWATACPADRPALKSKIAEQLNNKPPGMAAAAPGGQARSAASSAAAVTEERKGGSTYASSGSHLSGVAPSGDAKSEVERLLQLPVRELKQQVAQLGHSYTGLCEKQEFIQILLKARGAPGAEQVSDSNEPLPPGTPTPHAGAGAAKQGEPDPVQDSTTLPDWLDVLLASGFAADFQLKTTKAKIDGMQPGFNAFFAQSLAKALTEEGEEPVKPAQKPFTLSEVSMRQLQTTYRRLAPVLHPDKNRRQSSLVEFQRLQQAMEAHDLVEVLHLATVYDIPLRLQDQAIQAAVKADCTAITKAKQAQTERLLEGMVWRWGHATLEERSNLETDYRFTLETVYKGEVDEDGAAHGQGTMTYPDGSVYVGHFEHGSKHGHGAWSSDKGCKFVGTYDKGLQHGYGHYEYEDGSSYHGMWEKGDWKGLGVYTTAKGSVVEGKWVDGKLNGLAEKRYSECGSIYRGMWKDNVHHGFGVLIQKEGTIIGEWANDELLKRFI